jgi:hypothetical protein
MQQIRRNPPWFSAGVQVQAALRTPSEGVQVGRDIKVFPERS